MAWHRDSITPGELDALKQTAERAWGHDTAFHLATGRDRARGQCYVTARWLVSRLGGYVGVREGHYAWVSPNGRYRIDLTGNHGSEEIYAENDGYDRFGSLDNERTARFSKRANAIFDNLADLLKYSLDYMGDAFPGETPEAIEERNYWHDEPGMDPQSGEYRFVYGNGGLEISPAHDHRELADHAGLQPDFHGPVAVGWVVVTNGRATWEVQSNVNINSLERVFKDYGKQVGWQWGGITNIEGEPISDEFAPQKTSLIRFAFHCGHLYLGRVSHSELLLQGVEESEEAPRVGLVRIRGKRAEVYPVHTAAIPSLCEWAEDAGYVLYAASDDRLYRQEDLEMFNNGGANPGEGSNPVERSPGQDIDERTPAGLYQCPSCDRLFPTWHEYQRHRRTQEGEGDEPRPDGQFPEMNESPIQDSHFTPNQPDGNWPVEAAVIPCMDYREATRVAGFRGGREADDYYVAYRLGSPVGYARLREDRLRDLVYTDERVAWQLIAKVMKYAEKEPKDLLASPVPFIYDVKHDHITVGKPGQRTSDIPGRFTPGGIVEGVYEPGGKVFIRTMTNMPYTVRHLIELWYYQHPYYTVTQVHLRDDSGSDTRLAANEDVGDKIAGLVHADPAVHAVAQALREHGGNVFAVGGAVRDTILGKPPKDIDLMVTGIPGGEVEAILRRLPGVSDYTGKDFGVFRYRDHGHEVEVALPRRERSTGPAHTDFEVQADHTMSPEEDLYRRDYTGNAMGVDLSNGRFIDPYNGADDLRNGVLRSVHPESLAEDPLRVVRGLVLNARYGLQPDQTTRAEMEANAPSIEHLAHHRIREELDKLFEADNPAKAIRLAAKTGVLKYLMPEVDRCMGYDQNNPHHELELGDHLINVLDRTAEKSDDPDLRMAALLHDIGKPDSMWTDPVTGRSHFYEKRIKQPDGTVTTLGADHETLGAEMARDLLTRYGYKNQRVKRIAELIQHHMWPAFTSEGGARRFLNKVGDHADDLMTLRWADQGGKSAYPADNTLNLDTQQALLDRVRNEGQPTTQAALAINGNDLIAAGIPQGPQVGQILRQLTEAVLEDPRQNQRDNLLTLAREYANIQT